MDDNGDTTASVRPVPEDIKCYLIPLAVIALEISRSYFTRNSPLNSKRSPEFFFTINNELHVVNGSHSVVKGSFFP